MVYDLLKEELLIMRLGSYIFFVPDVGILIHTYIHVYDYCPLD